MSNKPISDGDSSGRSPNPSPDNQTAGPGSSSKSIPESFLQENVWQLADNTKTERGHSEEDDDDCQPKNLEGTTVATYELQTLIGMGGFGAVYRAVNHAASLPRLKYVAVKVLRSIASPAAHKAWKLETDALRSMSHPGIVSLLDSGLTEMGVAWLAMELVDGMSVDRFFARKPRDWAAIVHLMTLVCDAIEHAHSHGILHRDLKPSNILIRPDGSPVVADFGLVHFLSHESGVSFSLTLAGTPAYMAPEQILNGISPSRQPATAAIDVFGLGATLYSLLCGHPPRDRSFPLHTLAHTLANAPIPRLTMAEANCPTALHIVIEKALQIDPARRYSTVAELREDLQNVLEHRPIRARPTGRVEKFRLWARRQPALAGLTIVATALVLTVAGLGIHAASVANIASLEAEEVRRLADAYIIDFENYIKEVDSDPLIPEEARNGFIRRLRSRQNRIREASLSRSDMTYLANVGQFILVEYREQSGRSEDARDLLTSISTQFQLLHRAGYKPEDLAFDLFQTHIRLGQIEFSFRDMPKAARHFEAASGYIAELYLKDTSDPDYADCYAAILRKQGVHQIEMGDVTAAEKTLRQALELAEDTKRLSPDQPSRWRHIAGSWSDLALAAATAKDFTNADECWRQTLDSATEMLEAAKGDPLLRVDMHSYLRQHCDYCLKLNRLDEAESSLAEATRHTEILIRDRPDIAAREEFRANDIALRDRIITARAQSASDK